MWIFHTTNERKKKKNTKNKKKDEKQPKNSELCIVTFSNFLETMNWMGKKKDLSNISWKEK